MKVFLYSRVSTDKQELTQQRNKVQDFLDSRGWTIEKEIYDEDVSGYKVSYNDRGLRKLIDMMDEGDCLICSELSRLARKMADVNKLVNEDLKPRRLRLVIVSMGIDLDCSKMKAIDELILQNFAFAAQTEAEFASSRTQSALDAIQKEIDTTGQHVSKRSGRVITRLGRPKGCPANPNANKASAESKRNKARLNPHNIKFMTELRIWEKEHGSITPKDDIEPFMNQLVIRDLRTSSGLEFNRNRCWAMLGSMRKIFAT